MTRGSGVVDVLAASPASSGDPALMGEGRALSYGELGERVDARRSALVADGVEPSHAVPTAAETSVDGIVELLAFWRLGAVPVPLNARWTPAERETARRELEDVRLPNGTQVVLWTSGTSGRPRGVALSWANLEASARAAAHRLDLAPGDVWVASLSPAHVGGLALITRSVLLGGALLVPDAHDTASLLRALRGEVGAKAGAKGAGGAHGSAKIGEEAGETEGGSAKSAGAPGELRDRLVPTHMSVVPSHVSVVPTQLLRLLDEHGDRPAPAGLRCVLVGGAHAPAELVSRAVRGGWPVALTYGATEMSSQIATAPPELVRDVPGTVGRPLEGVEVCVDDGGELRVRGPTRALGYVGPDAGELADPEGWYRTGDLGRIDPNGLLWITGRRIDRIVSGGVTVDAVEIEEALRAHPAVIDACVVGVPDEEWGERVGAWIEPVVGELDLEELDRHLRDRLAPAKLPRLWHVEGGLPRNASGKVDRERVRRALERRAHGGARDGA